RIIILPTVFCLASAAASCATKQRFKEIRKTAFITGRVGIIPATKISKSAKSSLALLSLLLTLLFILIGMFPVFTILIVFLSFFSITQYLIGFVNLLEFFISFLVIRVYVRMVFSRQFAISFFYILCGRILCYAKCFVIINKIHFVILALKLLV